ncbi:purine-binding chemotaxis protein CheW [Bacillus sp. HMF5848]|uniref:chemotaxis protein CheW n=1 Tax=Bacillus sp. HMF5848 TaxID=2495421 RepID=UPI000F7961BB|nr:chemotaxis protein CheW [Bacillus sp. HMF5848]RSK28413.1 purine-binding chemotaxis protein CheW [Bacillus sp. HMF5848]
MEVTGRQYVVFSLQNQLVALTIEEVLEIIQLKKMTEVPGVANYILGMINLRGSIIPVVSLHNRYRINEFAVTKRSRIVVVQFVNESIGLLVDEVKMVTFIENTNISPTLKEFDVLEKECFKGFAKVNDKLIGILNLEKLLFPEAKQEGIAYD